MTGHLIWKQTQRLLEDRRPENRIPLQKWDFFCFFNNKCLLRYYWSNNTLIKDPLNFCFWGFNCIYKASLTSRIFPCVHVTNVFFWNPNDFKDFANRKKMRWNINLNMKTKWRRSDDRQQQRQISLDILIQEKAAAVSAQSSSVIQSQRLWREKGDG